MLKIQENISLAPHTTFKIGGPARYFCDIRSLSDLMEGLAFARKKRLSTFVLGGGSNVLIADPGFPGVVLRMMILGIEWEVDGEYAHVTAGAGVVWDELVEASVQRGYWGIENLSHVPGLVGTSVIQNIGCYGVEVSEVVEWVEEYDAKEGVVRRVPHHDCAFAYRDSIWKHLAREKRVVTRIRFRLAKNGSPKIDYPDLRKFFVDAAIAHPTQKDIRSALLEIRSGKFPDLVRYGTAGSFFKNPIVTKREADVLLAKFPEAPHFTLGNGQIKLSASWIIDHVLGLRGTRKGRVGTWKNQALALVNYGGASAEEMRSFAREIQDQCAIKTNVKLEPEVVFVE